MLVLATRADTMYQHSLNQLKRFLKSERLENFFINRTHEYFFYQWTRTCGLNTEALMTERLGIVFRQDLNFYYFKNTMVALDAVLKGGEPLQRELAGLSAEDYCLPGADIVREMDITPNVFIVHRGHVSIYKNKLKLATLTKGCIFGQLNGRKLRALHITARADDHVDCLRIKLNDFHKALSPKNLKNLTSVPTSNNDFIVMRKKLVENAYNTVRYILRGDYIIKFPMELDVVNSKLTMKYIRLKHFRTLELYVDILSLLGPILSAVTGYWQFNYCRALRMQGYFFFYKRLTKTIQTGAANILMKLGVFLLTVHIITCLTIQMVCVRNREDMAIKNQVPDWINVTIEHKEWLIATGNAEKGCYLTIINFKPDSEPVETKLMSRNWAIDYLLAINYVLGALASFNNPTIIPEHSDEYIFKIVSGFILMLFNLWFTAEAISVMLTKFHELYEYDYHVMNLFDYMRKNRVCSFVIDTVQRHTEVMWARQKGTWLPDIVHQGSLCLREDHLFSELYMHHFLTNPVYRELPHYILRQLATQCSRILLLPGHYIVRERDIRPVLYFIHEGEVEKWRLDRETGEYTLVSLLTTGGYFGTIPSLFPTYRFMYSFYSRTVVDAVLIHYDTIHPLLMCYPEEKKQLYIRAHRFKTNILSTRRLTMGQVVPKSMIRDLLH